MIADLLWFQAFGLALFSIGAGFFGSLLGLGGGFIIVPALTLWLGMDLKSSAGIALIAVIASSSGSSVTYLKKAYANLELAAFLEVSTVTGAIVAVFVRQHIPTKFLYIIFAGLLITAAVSMLRKNHKSGSTKDAVTIAPVLSTPAAFPNLTGKFQNEQGVTQTYQVSAPWLGFFISGIAGLLSGLLGVGGGIIKVPTMNTIMGVPLKAASATSNLMVGMTAATTATLMLLRSEIPLALAALVAMGVYAGARLGSQRLQQTSNQTLSWTFFVFALFIAMQMLIKGVSL